MSAKQKGRRRGKAPSKRAMRGRLFWDHVISRLPFLGVNPSADDRFDAVMLFGGYVTEDAPRTLIVDHQSDPSIALRVMEAAAANEHLRPIAAVAIHFYPPCAARPPAAEDGTVWGDGFVADRLFPIVGGIR